MNRTFFILTLLLISNFSFSQRIEKVFLDKDDTTKNCYTIIYPNAEKVKGYIVLIPGFGETPERVFEQTNLPILTATNELITVIPTLQDGVFSFGVDSSSQHSLTTIIEDAKNKNKLDKLNFYIGGFSIGGSCAIKYAETLKEKPLAVFAIDPPLDFERFYYSSKRDVRLSVNQNPSQENVYMINRIEKEFHGTPETAINHFYKISPYSFSDTTQTAIKKLLTTTIRIYSEPDINWWIKERNADVTSMNITDCAPFINELKRLGNTNATLITTEGKGFRKPNNQRHPHSWSIVNNEELIEWLLKQR